MRYQPYGALHHEHLREIEVGRLPELWQDGPQKNRFAEWSERMLDDLRNDLWPTWDRAGGWHGDAESQMDALTALDLSLMDPLLSQVGSVIPNTVPEVTQFEAFLAEDSRQGRGPGAYLEAYWPALDPRATGYSPELFFRAGGRDLIGSVLVMHLKNWLQRPRPYQVAMQQGIDPFRRLRAITADSPAMISGHCFEGIVAGSWVYKLLRGELHDLDWAAGTAYMQQWAADIGDRRVLANVHYPSDNIASWWVALSLFENLEAQGVEEIAGLRDFARGAIRRSRVYQRLKASGINCRLWDRLVREMEGA